MAWWDDPFGGRSFHRRSITDYVDPKAVSRVNSADKLADYVLFRIRFGLAADRAEDRSSGRPSITHTNNMLINLADSDVLSAEVLNIALQMIARKSDPNYECVVALVAALRDKADRNEGTPITTGQIHNMTSLPVLIETAKGLIKSGYHVQSIGAKHPPQPVSYSSSRREESGHRRYGSPVPSSAFGGYGSGSRGILF